MLSSCIALTVPFLLNFATLADTVVAPNDLATNDATFGSGILRAANYRAQSIYAATHFPPDIGLLITELRFRPDRFYGAAFSTTIENIQVNLSTSARNPDGLSAGFADNVGDDDTTVFSGALTCSSQFTGPPEGPKDFDIIIPLTTPFLYNPAAGNLLIDVRNFSGSPVASHLSGQVVAGDAASRVGGTLSSGAGGADTGVEALQIVYTPTNQPPIPPQPTLLVRGPYLQSVTTSNIIVRWRTQRPTNSVVQFGLDEPFLGWGVTNAPLTNEHVVTLTNLAPDTKYFYSIGASDTNLASGSNYFFVTAPATRRPTRIWAMGDFGTAHQPYFGIVNDPQGMRDSYYAFTSNRYTDVWLMLGDNAYNIGTDEEYQTNVFGIFPQMLRQTAAWSAIGNHDAVSSSTYLNIFSFPQNGEAGGVPSGSELYYSFNYGNIHFVALDSEISVDSALAPMLTWLEQDLAENTNDWLIAFWHSPPYSFSSHNSDSLLDSGGHLVTMREAVVPILESYGVDLVLNGHSHAYERSFLIDGHYGYANTFDPSMVLDGGSGCESDTGAYLKMETGPAAHQGAVYTVCGSSGWVTGPAVTLDRYLKHPTTAVGLPRVGSFVMDVDGHRLDARFLNHVGVVEDHFTIRKGVEPEPLRIATSKVQGGAITLQFKTVAGRRYRIEHARQLGPSDWRPLGEEMVATGATTKWTAPAPADTTFYRIAQLPAVP